MTGRASGSKMLTAPAKVPTKSSENGEYDVKPYIYIYYICQCIS